MNKLQELSKYWKKSTTEQKKDFFFNNNIRVYCRSSESFSPCHPIYNTPSNETFRSEWQAGIAQVDWLVNFIDADDLC